MAKNDEFTPTNPNMLFDLRQTYAMHLITPILIELRIHRKEDNFQKWFETITEDLFVEVNQKLTEDERKEYQLKYNNCITELNKYPGVYRGGDKNPERKGMIKKAIMALELWLKERMEDHGLYGKGSEYDWDEI